MCEGSVGELARGHKMSSPNSKMKDPDGNIVIDRLAASIDEKSPASKSEHNLFVGSSEI